MMHFNGVMVCKNESHLFVSDNVEREKQKNFQESASNQSWDSGLREADSTTILDFVDSFVAASLIFLGVVLCMLPTYCVAPLFY